MTEHKSLAEAMAAFQADVQKLHKGETAKAGSFSYKYIDLAAVVDGIQDTMAQHGLSFSAFPCYGPDGHPALRYTLRHAAGDIESDVMPLMVAKPDAQALGSAITYGRRYALCAVLNLVADEDDDGAAAKAAARQQPAQRATVQFKPALPAELVDELRQLYVESGWDRQRLHAQLDDLGAVAVEELSVEKAHRLRDRLNSEIEKRGVPATSE